ncbi:MAG: class IV adenylate cyclase [Deltaproteobacteria bacterium]|nr:class IV adenylate cyclase [Deltaproteobacteria bacterium]
MPRNIEIKARIADLGAVRAAVERLGARPHVVEVQTDRYYARDGGRRLKLRSIEGGRAELIDYARPEASGVRASDYTISPLRDGDRCAVPSGEPLVVVRKRREVLRIDNVRVHLDRVEGLGTFLELEAVVDAAHDDAVCRAQVARILDALGLADRDLIRASYADLVPPFEKGG